MNDFFKIKIKFKNQLYNQLYDSDYNMLQEVINKVSKIVSRRKEKFCYHIASKLNNPSTSFETCWSILKTFYNIKKVPLIPLLQIGSTLFSDFNK